jgi:hypothetical protein
MFNPQGSCLTTVLASRQHDNTEPLLSQEPSPFSVTIFYKRSSLICSRLRTLSLQNYNFSMTGQQWGLRIFVQAMKYEPNALSSSSSSSGRPPARTYCLAWWWGRSCSAPSSIHRIEIESLAPSAQHPSARGRVGANWSRCRLWTCGTYLHFSPFLTALC